MNSFVLTVLGLAALLPQQAFAAPVCDWLKTPNYSSPPQLAGPNSFKECRQDTPPVETQTQYGVDKLIVCTVIFSGQDDADEFALKLIAEITSECGFDDLIAGHADPAAQIPWYSGSTSGGFVAMLFAEEKSYAPLPGDWRKDLKSSVIARDIVPTIELAFWVLNPPGWKRGGESAN